MFMEKYLVRQGIKASPAPYDSRRIKLFRCRHILLKAFSKKIHDAVD